MEKNEKFREFHGYVSHPLRGDMFAQCLSLFHGYVPIPSEEPCCLYSAIVIQQNGESCIIEISFGFDANKVCLPAVVTLGHNSEPLLQLGLFNDIQYTTWKLFLTLIVIFEV